MIERPLTAVFAAVLLVLTLGAASALAAPPRRIVSLNLCTDEIVLDLVPRDRIAAVSHLAADPLVSPVAEQARGIPWTRGEAEVVLAFEPDLVLAGMFTTPATLDLLERVGRRVVRVPTASDIAGIHVAIRAVAEAVGERERGEALIAGLDARLRAAAGGAKPSRQLSALVYQVNGLSAGPGSLADELIKAAGLANHASAVGLSSSGALPLELLAANPPDLVVLAGAADEYRTAVAENLRHPALAAVLREHASVVVPWRYWLCGTQHVATAVESLAESRRRIEEQGRMR